MSLNKGFEDDFEIEYAVNLGPAINQKILTIKLNRNMLFVESCLAERVIKMRVRRRTMVVFMAACVAVVWNLHNLL